MAGKVSLPLAVQGMHGLGDNIHQRGIIRQLMERHVVWLETPWPAVYYDLVGERLRLVNVGSNLRTQAKNIERQSNSYCTTRAPNGIRRIRITYSANAVRECGSIFSAMCRTAGVIAETADYRFPVPQGWVMKAMQFLPDEPLKKPILFYRPLVQRTEWDGCASRNPDFDAYAELFASIRDKFFVVSIADLEPGKEWMVGRPIEPDLVLHRGELDVEALFGMMKLSSLVWCSPGFASVMAPAIGRPAIVVFGGHESSMTISFGQRFSPLLGIDPIHPCDCFSNTHACRKEIDIPASIHRIRAFVDENCTRLAA